MGLFACLVVPRLVAAGGAFAIRLTVGQVLSFVAEMTRQCFGLVQLAVTKSFTGLQDMEDALIAGLEQHWQHWWYASEPTAGNDQLREANFTEQQVKILRKIFGTEPKSRPQPPETTYSFRDLLPWCFLAVLARRAAG